MFRVIQLHWPLSKRHILPISNGNTSCKYLYLNLMETGSFVLVHIRVQTHEHTYIHTYTQTRIHTYIRIYIHTHTHSLSLLHCLVTHQNSACSRCGKTYVHIHMHIHTYVDTYLRTNIHIHIRTCRRTYG